MTRVRSQLGSRTRTRFGAWTNFVVNFIGDCLSICSVFFHQYLSDCPEPVLANDRQDRQTDSLNRWSDFIIKNCAVTQTDADNQLTNDFVLDGFILSG